MTATILPNTEWLFGPEANVKRILVQQYYKATIKQNDPQM